MAQPSFSIFGYVLPLAMNTNPKEQPTSRRLQSLLPGLVITGGILLTLWMQVFSQNGVVFSGDGGLKALLSQQIAQQLSTGSWPLEMSLSLPVDGTVGAEWINAVWQQGLYPFTPPFVYEVGLQHFITFPFTFPAITAPFYALFGDRGLYTVPLLALWATWARFWQIGKRIKLDTLALCLGLVVLIFASPLSLYGGMYWEHTLAVALAFWGVTALLFPKNSVDKLPYTPGISGYRALYSGILIGLAVWFRPEFLCLVAAVGLLAAISWLRPSWRLSPQLTFAKVFILVGAMACTMGIFFALNYGIYGHPLGIHAIQIVEESSVATQVNQAKDSYVQMWRSLWRYFPTVILLILLVLCQPKFSRAGLKTTSQFKGFKTPKADSIGIVSPAKTAPVPTRFVLVLSILFALSVPLIVPPGSGGKQWGPRFYLILVPLLSLVLADQLRAGYFLPWARRLAIVGTAVMLVFGIHTNTINGAFNIFKDEQTQSTSLAANYEPIAPAIAELKQQPLPWIAMSHQFVAQQLWNALPEKTFFRTETIAEVKQLSDALAAQNEREFLYVCYPHRDCPTPDTPASELGLESGGSIAFESLGTYGKYPLYRVAITS